ncbi:hypothetical protein [Hahella sp. HN01]|uniref:hypothetical protein n=1 Tax=Hahella sp. HN01 TaxID=2847262 RepID=UPI001C1F1CCB|nr:hypothetical protein [Hahella sp. HN01]MBU6954505.1 hypothetical protein [Hahella sp. HN01]
MKKLFAMIAMTFLSSSAMADMSGKWTLAYDYGCDGTNKASVLTFTEESSDASESKGVFATSGGGSGRYLEKKVKLDHVLIFQYKSNNTYNTVYAAKNTGVNNFTGVMQNTGNDAGSITGCFYISRLGSINGMELEPESE